MTSRTPMSDLQESVQNIVAEVLSEQDRFSANLDGAVEPDPRVVTRDIINKVADKLEAEIESHVLQDPLRSIVRPRDVYHALHWLRSQAPDSGESE